MKIVTCFLTGAMVVGSTVVGSAQDVRFRIDTDRDRDRHYEHRDHGRHLGWRKHHHEDCRTVVIRERRPNGDVITRRTQRCD